MHKQSHILRYTFFNRALCKSLPSTFGVHPNNRCAHITLSTMASAHPSSKRQKLDGPLIGTHSGHFHADEALAVYLLRLLPTYHASPLVRTRDTETLAKCHTVVDVGGEYDIAKNRYDHHQRGFNEVFPGKNTKLSSAGLVYLNFGKRIIAQQTDKAEDSDEVATLWEKCYEDLVEAFDANDNGVDVYDQDQIKSAGITKRFENRGFSIASVVNRLNYFHPDDPEADKAKSKDVKQQEEDDRFEEASRFTGQQFVSELQDKWRSWLPARTMVTQAYNARRDVDPSGQILALEEGCPWADHLYRLEAETPSSPKVLYILFPEGAEPGSKWRIRAVGVEAGGFQNRKDLPDAWKGLRDEELSRVSGVDGCVFVHAAGFIGGNLTYEGALSMAQKAVAA